ncbi:MAG: aldehyde dehydrogenase family protein [Candidatus Sericytochromatia bacterium]|nr:aldehyde dehydrogenase family protein [Candidatus Tanganyikabacteria bacterium]
MRQFVFGTWRDGALERQDIVGILHQARARAAVLRDLPLADILDLLDRLSRRWADPGDRFRQAALAGLPAQLGFSPQMVEQDLAGFVMALSRPYAERKIRSELGSLACLDGFERRSLPGAGPFLRAVPRGVVLHVAAGNVGSVGVLSLVEGLLAKNVGVLKAASAAPLFPELFAESLRDTDHAGDIAGAVAILNWSGRRAKHHKLFQEHADGIVVWGGEEAVREYRDGLGLQATLVEWGPKVSAALVAKEADLGAAARAAARDVSMWDQNACSSAQVIYVEDPERVPDFVSALESELSAFADRLPMGDLSLQERAEITKTRELALLDVALGTAELHVPAGDTPAARQQWTVIVETDPAFKLSPLFRTVYVKPVGSLEDCRDLLAPYASYLQTIGLAAPPERLLALADALAGCGALRLTALGEMSGGYPGEPHDGAFALQRLVKWISLGGVPPAGERFDPADFLDDRQVDALQWRRLRAVFRRVRALSPFYARRLPAADPADPAAWAALPALSKAEYRGQVPPEGREMLCGDDGDALTLRSGGSSGVPMVALISREDFEADMRAAAIGAYAAGMRPGDRVANLFYAGNLYGSFLSTNRIVEIVGCRNFPLTSAAPMADILEALATFRIDTVIGLPSHLQLVFAAMREAGGKFHLCKAFFAGEHFYAKERAYWSEVLGLERIASIGYGTVDAGPIAFQCAAAEGSVHHVLVGHQFVEVVARESLAPIPPGEVGELLVTNLHDRLMPLVRYRIGDLGRLVPGACACGRSAPRFELLGRADDVAVVGGYNLPYAAFLHVVERIPGLLTAPQLELRQPEHRDVLVVKVELDGSAGTGNLAPADGLEGELRSLLGAEIPELRKALETGQLEALEIRVLPPGGLDRLGRTGKIVHVVDRRRRTGQLL